MNVRGIHRFATSLMVSLRNLTAPSPHVVTGGLRTIRRSHDQAAPSRSPMARANRFLQSINANRSTDAARISRPTIAGINSAAVVFPVIARNASATTGSASFVKLFQIPVVEISNPICDPVNPHDRNTSVTNPTAMTPPPGRMLEIVVPIWLFTAACPSVRPGIAACVCHQYVNRLKTMAPVTPSTCSGLSCVTVFHTEE